MLDPSAVKSENIALGYEIAMRDAADMLSECLARLPIGDPASQHFRPIARELRAKAAKMAGVKR
jgi:hypothetical protein